MMRILFPLALLTGVVVMLLTALASLALSLVVPLLLIAAGVALIASLRSVRAGIEIMRAGTLTMTHAFEFLGDVLRLLFVWPSVESELTDAQMPQLIVRMPSAQFTQLHFMQLEAARLLGKKPVDEVWVSPDCALGIGTALHGGKRIRFLCVGLELVRMWEPEQLRAALLHEFGHEKGGDLWLGKWARRMIHQLAHAAHQFAWFNPARWAAELSLLVVQAGYFPWSRAMEFAADRWSVRFAGPVVACEALRVARRESPIREVALQHVLARAVARKMTPPRLGDAVNFIVSRVPAVERHRLSVMVEGDPLELGGRTHPTTAARLAAMAKLPRLAAPASVPAFDAERLNALDEQLTKRWLEGVGKPVSLEVFFSEPAAAPEPVKRSAPVMPYAELEAPVEVLARSDTPPVDDDAPLELDDGRDWWRKNQPE